jgi:hypothetical protein
MYVNQPFGFQRLGVFPLDKTSVFETYELFANYVENNPTAYAGQICSISTTSEVYVITSTKGVQQIGASGGTPSGSPDQTALALAIAL